MGDAVVIYPSARERREQNRTQTDEVWQEKPRKSKKSIEFEFLRKTSKKVLTNGGKCAKISKTLRSGDKKEAVPCKLNNAIRQD